MNTKKILFAVAAIGMLSLTNYVVENSSDEPQGVERAAITKQQKQK